MGGNGWLQWAPVWLALVAVGGDVSSPGSHRCCRDRGGQCKWRGGGQGGGQVPGGEQDLLLPSPALPVTGHFPAGRRRGPLRGAALQGRLGLTVPSRAVCPATPAGASLQDATGLEKSKLGPLGPPPPPRTPHPFLPHIYTSRLVQPGACGWPRPPELGAPRVLTWGTEGRGSAGQDPTAPHLCGVS